MLWTQDASIGPQYFIHETNYIKPQIGPLMLQTSGYKHTCFLLFYFTLKWHILSGIVVGVDDVWNPFSIVVVESRKTVSTVLKYKLRYFYVTFHATYVIVLLHHISEDNILLSTYFPFHYMCQTATVTSFFSGSRFCMQNILFSQKYDAQLLVKDLTAWLD